MWAAAVSLVALFALTAVVVVVAVVAAAGIELPSSNQPVVVREAPFRQMPLLMAALHQVVG